MDNYQDMHEDVDFIDDPIDLDDMQSKINRLTHFITKAQNRVRSYERMLEKETSVSEKTMNLVNKGLQLFNVKNAKRKIQ